MRDWPMPIQITEEEKIFSGILTLRQLLWLFLGFGCGLVGAFVPPVSPAFMFIIFVFVSLAGCLFAFLPVAGVSLDIYFHRLFLFRRRNTKLFLR